MSQSAGCKSVTTQGRERSYSGTEGESTTSTPYFDSRKKGPGFAPEKKKKKKSRMKPTPKPQKGVSSLGGGRRRAARHIEKRKVSAIPEDRPHQLQEKGKGERQQHLIQRIEEQREQQENNATLDITPRERCLIP